MPTPYFYPSTAHPPALSADEHAAVQQENIPWMLLEVLPYLAKRENATTACCDSWDGKEIQVTLCPRRPPYVSYLCIHSPRDDIQVEPEIIATEDDLIVFRVSFGSLKEILSNVDNLHYYVYQADDGSGRPSLKHLPRILPRCRSSFDARDMGILRYDLAATKEYIVAGIVADVRGSRFTLYLYDSGQQGEEDCWTIHTVSLNHEHQQRYSWDDEDHFHHVTRKVMAIGGQDATMAFVDLWRGILFCDVRKLQHQAVCQQARDEDVIPILSFVPLPSSMDKDKEPRGDARLWRNIAVIDGRLKYVELQRHPTGGWAAATFSRPVESSDGDCWVRDCYVDTNTTDFSKDPLLKLLPRGRSYDGRTVPPFKKLHIRQPVLGLQQGADTIFFTPKVGRLSENAWVVAIDMRNKALLGVAAFSASRTVCIDFAYIQSRTSKYLNKDPSNIGTLSTGSTDAEPNGKFQSNI